MSYGLGMQYLDKKITETIDKIIKNHEKKYLQGVINKFKEGGKRKTSKRKTSKRKTSKRR